MKLNKRDKKFLKWFNDGRRITILAYMKNTVHINSFLKLNDHNLIENVEYDEDYNISQGSSVQLKKLMFFATLTLKGKWIFFKLSERQLVKQM